MKYSKKSNAKKGLSWLLSGIITWMIITEGINLFLHSYTDFEHIHDLIYGAFRLYDNYWNNLFYLLTVICIICIFLLIVLNLEFYIRLLIFKRQLPNVISEFSKLKSKINHTIISLIDIGDDDHIKERDEIYADLLRQMQSEFDIEGVSIDSINQCTESLMILLNNSQPVTEIYALTNLYGDSWLTRTMLLYLIRTIQIADKIADQSKKLRVFIRNNNGYNKDDKAYISIKSLHEGFLPIKEIALETYKKDNPQKIDSFLLLKLNNGQELFWHVNKIETKLYWKYSSSTLDPSQASEINEIIAYLKNLVT